MFMNYWTVIKAPLAVQVNRIVFALYAALWGWVLWHFHRIASVEGTCIFLCMFLLSVQGLVSSCIRARRSRWIMAALGLLIPGIFITSMFLMEFSSPERWLDWLLTGFGLISLFFIPFMLGLSLFISDVSFDKKRRALDIRPSQKCIEYFKARVSGPHADFQSVTALPGK